MVKLLKVLCDALTLSKPMGNFELKTDKNRLSDYGAYIYMNEDREIDWRKIF